MEVYGKSMFAEPSNVIYLSTILNQDGPLPSHKCDVRCQNEHVFGNMFRCKLTGITHICDKNCNQRILYDNHSSLCRVSGQIFPLSPSEEQAVKGIRRKLEVENSDGCAFKRRRDAKMHPSPFERSFRAVSPICSQVGDGMDMSEHENLLPILRKMSSMQPGKSCNSRYSRGRLDAENCQASKFQYWDDATKTSRGLMISRKLSMAT